MSSNAILVLLQQAQGRLHPISAEVAAAARDLAEQSSGEAFGILLTDEWNIALEQQVKYCGLDTVYVCRSARFGSFIAEEQAHSLGQCVQNLRPDILLAGATPEGRALAAMVAAALNTGVTADCTALSFRADGLLLQTRPAFGGSVMAQIVTPTARPQIATLRYTAIRPACSTKTNIIFKEITDEIDMGSGVKAEWIDRVLPNTSRDRTVIALGGGLAAKEDMALFERLAQYTGAALMCSRALVERGWFPRSRQIGLSGQRIQAQLLITFGISGSVQFMSGVQGVQKLCAVNSDDTAPILKAADIPIMGDMYAIAREMCKKC